MTKKGVLKPVTQIKKSVKKGILQPIVTEAKKVVKKGVKKPASTEVVKKKVVKKGVKKALLESKLDELNELQKQLQGNDSHTLSVVDAVCNDLQNVRTEFVFAEVFHRISCPTYHMEAMYDKFWRDYVLRYGVPALELIYDKLKDPVNYNDGDDDMWVIPDPKGEDRRILVHKSQNLRFLFVWDKNLSEDKYGFGDIHVRRFYDRYEYEESDFEINFGLGEISKADTNAKRIKWAIRHASDLSNYADDLDNTYPERYSLEYYADKKFEMQYGDARDRGFVFSSKGWFPSLSNGGTIAQHSLLKIVWDCYIPCMLSELYSCPAFDCLMNQFNSKGGLTNSNEEGDEE